VPVTVSKLGAAPLFALKNLPLLEEVPLMNLFKVIDPSAVPSVSTCCPKTNPKNDKPLAGLVVKVMVLPATV